MTSLRIRQETPSDFDAIHQVVAEAFKNAEHTDGDEHNLVQRLRNTPHYIPELALVAEIDGRIAGHVLFTRIRIGKAHDSLALAPVSVHPEFQGRGIGGKLIEEGHRIAAKMGFSSVILLGHPAYYPRFGYRPASQWKIQAPFDVPDEAFMALELVPGALENVSGTVEYAAAFFERSVP